MKYFTGFLVKGEAAEFQQKISREVREQFMSEMRSPKIPPHITIFRPFTTEDPKPIKEFLKSWTESNPKLSKLTFSDFEHFDDRTIFLHVDMDKKTCDAVIALQREIEKITGVHLNSHSVWNPHVTVATRIMPHEFESIWNRVKEEEKKEFTVPFDNITLFKLKEETREWIVDEIFPIK
ncbi:2'-5' RNA ligase family protein [Candidatus Parcubacteria bacterium]|nr:2'-5' RNA ligase family protein [Candidatus Parcubacteria bacterium]